MADTPTPDQITGLYQKYLKRTPSPDEITTMQGNPNGIDGIQQTILSSPEYAGTNTPSSKINSQNPSADPNKPFVQDGDTGGYLDRVGVTIGAGSSLTPAQAKSFYDAGVAKYGQAAVDDFLSRNNNDYARIDTGLADLLGGGGSGSSNGSNGAGTPYWQASTPTAPTAVDLSPLNSLVSAVTGQLSQNNTLVQQLMERQAAQEAANQAKASSLYNTLMDRASQSLDISPTDPIIAGQVNAYRAEQDRATRNYLNGLAESSGPYANMTAQSRIANEQAGQHVGSFQATLMGNELQQRRDEIAQALSGMAGLLTADQQNALQKQLALLDNAIKQQNIGVTAGLGLGSQSNDLLRTMLQNSQYYAGLQSNNDQFNAQFGLNAAQQAAYWDALRRGLLS